MFTCLIRYHVAPGKLAEFREYATVWMTLIEDYGGTHHGYFVPGDDPDEFPNPSFSFPGLGHSGPDHIAVALFSFPDVDSYDTYKRKVALDARCHAATQRFNETKCFTGYERTFLQPILPSHHPQSA